MNQYNFETPEKLIKSIIFKDGKFYCNDQEVQVAAKGDPGKTPQKGVDYFDGIDGIGSPPDHKWDGTKIRFRNPDGTWGSFVNLQGKGEAGYTPKKGVDYFDGEDGKTPEKGVDYKDGEDGKTPEKGVDYKDGEDGKPGVEPEEMARIRTDLGLMRESIKEMQEVVKAITKVAARVKDGDPGKTPEKGVDYFDGVDGYCPKKGVDYKDGEDAKIPESVTMTVITDVKLIDGALSIKRQDVKFYL